MLLFVKVDEIDGSIEACGGCHLLILRVHPWNHNLLLLALQDVLENLWVCLAFGFLKHAGELLRFGRTLHARMMVLYRGRLLLKDALVLVRFKSKRYVLVVLGPFNASRNSRGRMVSMLLISVDLKH